MKGQKIAIGSCISCHNFGKAGGHAADASFFLLAAKATTSKDSFRKKVIDPRSIRLEEIITPVPGIQVGGYIEKHGTDLFQLAKEKGLEGIVAKRKRSTYQPGKRSPDWLKIKSRPQQEFVVCGITEGQGSRKHFGEKYSLTDFP